MNELLYKTYFYAIKIPSKMVMWPEANNSMKSKKKYVFKVCIYMSPQVHLFIKHNFLTATWVSFPLPVLTSKKLSGHSFLYSRQCHGTLCGSHNGTKDALSGQIINYF